VVLPVFKTAGPVPPLEADAGVVATKGDPATVKSRAWAVAVDVSANAAGASAMRAAAPTAAAAARRPALLVVV
jgi:hypothetical protein